MIGGVMLTNSSFRILLLSIMVLIMHSPSLGDSRGCSTLGMGIMATSVVITMHSRHNCTHNIGLPWAAL